MRGRPPELILLLLLLLPTLTWSLRCFTDVMANKGESVDCGEGAGCIKVYLDSEVHLMKLHDTLQRKGHMLELGKLPELPPAYRDNPVLLRGCFTLSVPDRCYHAQDGYSYCWCSSKDLCNSAEKRAENSLTLLLALLIAVVWRR